MKNIIPSNLRFFVFTAVLGFVLNFAPGIFPCSAFTAAYAADPEITVPLRFDRYYNYRQLVEAVQKLHEAYPRLSEIEVVGKSEENREIWAITINNPGTGEHYEKPGVYVDGNIHGNEIQTGETCLYLANMLLTKYGENEKITRLVDKNAFYIIPSVNVDGRYHFFEDPNTPSTNRGLRIPKDDDRDGLFDEDFPDDLDGDGSICQMRKKDPNGEYKLDPDDPRIMVRAEPGEKGEYTMLGQEGIDNDGDGNINEDSEGYVDPNRNWGYNWAPTYVQRGSGDYPFSGSGIRAIGEFILERQNIIMVWAFHNTGGMILRGPSTPSSDKFSRGDLAVYDYLGKNSEYIIPGYRYLIVWKDLYTTYGDFTGFTDNLVGSYSFVGEMFMRESQTYGPQQVTGEEGRTRRGSRDQQKELLEFNDHVVQGELYKEWEPYDHPVYGEIEIGGWKKMSSRLPHPFMLQDEVHRTASAVLFTAGQTPEVEMELFEQEKISVDLNRLRVRLTNSKAMPSITHKSVKNKLYPKDILSVTGNNISVVAGGEIENRYTDLVSYKEYKPGVQFLQVSGFGHVEYEFLVSGRGNVTIEYRSRKAGRKELELKL
ncbi:MAG: M14 family metallopeptidase [Bacteroidales bacterium]